MGDINAQVAACKIGARRLTELAGKFGHNALTAIFDELLTRSETMTRQALARIPEGTYRLRRLSSTTMGSNSTRTNPYRSRGHGPRRRDPYRFTGTSDQVRGPLNCVPSGSLAAACFAIRALTDPAIPTKAGASGRSRLHLPEGSLVNPTRAGTGERADLDDQADHRRDHLGVGARCCRIVCRRRRPAKC